MELQQIKSRGENSPTVTLGLPETLLVTSDSPIQKSSHPFKCFSCPDAIFPTHSLFKRQGKHHHGKITEIMYVNFGKEDFDAS